MRTSEQTAELDKALSEAQGQFPSVKKLMDNDYFNSKYADLAAWSMLRSLSLPSMG